MAGKSKARSRHRVLIADDDPMLVKLVEYKLTHDGFEVITAADGEQALAAAKSALPDLVILDAMMPGLDGFEVLRRLKEDPSTREIVVVMLTARRLEHDIVGGLKIGAADYIVKPFLPDELLARVRRLMPKRGQDENA